MTVPVLGKEGARIGGLHGNDDGYTVAASFRATGAAVNLYIDVYSDSGRTHLVASSAATAVADGVWGTTYLAASVLTAGRTYYWAVRAADQGTPADTVTGSAEPLIGSFKTPHSDRSMRLGMISCHRAWTYYNRFNQADVNFNNILNYLDIDYYHVAGDVYYVDGGVTRNSSGANVTNAVWISSGDDAVHAMQDGSWFAQVVNTDDSTVLRWRNNAYNTMLGPAGAGNNGATGNEMTAGHVLAKYPSTYMWDDHDKAWNDCDDMDFSQAAAATGELTKRNHGHQVSHEFMLNLNKSFIDNDPITPTRDFDVDALGTATYPADSLAPEEYFINDYPHARLLVMDTRSYRDANSSTDDGTIASPNKTMLGAKQLAWVKAAITEHGSQVNGCPPFLIIDTGVMPDGNHGYDYDITGDDNWKFFSYEWHHIMRHIADFGNPSRTLLFSGDTHHTNVIKFHASDGNPCDLISVTTANQAFPADDSGAYLTGLSSGARTGMPDVSAVGYGAKQLMCVTEQPAITIIDSARDRMRVEIWSTFDGEELKPNSRPKQLWSYTFN